MWFRASFNYPVFEMLQTLQALQGQLEDKPPSLWHGHRLLGSLGTQPPSFQATVLNGCQGLQAKKDLPSKEKRQRQKQDSSAVDVYPCNTWGKCCACTPTWGLTPRSSLLPTHSAWRETTWLALYLYPPLWTSTLYIYAFTLILRYSSQSEDRKSE